MPRPLLGEDAADVAERARLRLDELAAERDEPVEVDADELAAEQRAQPAFHHGLHERAERQAVARRDDVQRPAHQRDPYDESPVDHAREIVGMKTLQARPQPVVRPVRVLRLQADEVLECLADEQRLASQQQLALEQRAVQRARRQDGLGPSDRGVRPMHRERGAAWHHIGHAYGQPS